MFHNFYHKITPIMLALTLGVGVVLPVQVQAVPALSGLFGAKPKFLPVHQAFNVSAGVTNDVLTVRFRITPEHYIYKDKLKLALPDGVAMGGWQFDSTPSMIDDPEFGRVAVFEHDVVATVKLTNQRATAFDESIKLTWQGCAKAGLCYPPENVKVNVVLSPSATTQAHVEQGASGASEQVSKISSAPNLQSTKKTLTMDEGDDRSISAGSYSLSTANGINVGQMPQSTSIMPLAGDQSEQALASAKQPKPLAQSLNQPLTTELNQSPTSTSAMVLVDDGSDVAMAEVVQSGQAMPKTAQYLLNHTPQAVNKYGFGLDKNPILAIGLLFLAGIALAFTACVYPMIPIVANIVAKSHKPTAMRGFILTSAYGLGVATSYGFLGAMVAWFGQGLGIVGWLQNRWILSGFALLFVLFALQMVGFIKLGLPAVLKQKLSQHATLADRHLGSVWGSFGVGGLSALVVSPCVSAPMAGALAAVAVSGNVMLGFGALFALGLGLSVPLIIMGTLEGKFMPKAGVWMEEVKRFAALMLFAVGLAMLDRAWASPVVLVLWAVWFALLSLFFWQLARAWRVLAMVAGAWVCVLMMGVGVGANDVLRPLHPITDKPSVGKLPDITITSLAELDDILKTTPNVLVDVTAEWCVECRIMERTLFANRPLAMADWQLVRLDITETTEKSQAILKRYQLFGPPALLYYQKGQLIQVQVGEVSYQDFEMALQIGQ